MKLPPTMEETRFTLFGLFVYGALVPGIVAAVVIYVICALTPR